jgi:hypothetical protein
MNHHLPQNEGNSLTRAEPRPGLVEVELPERVLARECVEKFLNINLNEISSADQFNAELIRQGISATKVTHYILEIAVEILSRGGESLSIIKDSVGGMRTSLALKYDYSHEARMIGEGKSARPSPLPVTGYSLSTSQGGRYQVEAAWNTKPPSDAIESTLGFEFKDFRANPKCMVIGLHRAGSYEQVKMLLFGLQWIGANVLNWQDPVVMPEDLRHPLRYSENKSNGITNQAT